LKVVKAAASRTVAGGSVVNTTFVGAPAITVIPELVPVVRALEESVAVSVQGLVPPSMVTAVKVATPATATIDVVPVMVHAEVMAIVSVALTPVVITFPYVSSVETLNVVRTVPAVAEAGGCVVKPTLARAAWVTATAELVPVVRFSEVSVAKRVHEVPVLMVTAVKVATPATAAIEVVPPIAHADVMAMVSVEEAPVVSTAFDTSSTETAKLARATPAVVVEGG